MVKTTGFKMKRALALLLTLALLVSVLPMAVLAAPDYTGHWAEKSIARAVEMGWFADESDTRPNDNISRAEFVTMVNRMMEYTGEADISGYSDVEPGDWYYGAFAAAVENGYIQGDEGKLNPTAFITRNEAVAIFTRISGLDTTGDFSAVFSAMKDSDEIPEWARPYAGAAASNGLIAGSEGKLNGKDNITRAQTAVLLERIFDETRTYGFAGTYSAEANNVIVAAAGITLKDSVIKGDLTISEAVGDGAVTLNNVKVEGKLNVEGGGLNSVYLENCEVADIIVTKDEVRIVFKDGTVAVHTNLNGENSQIVIGEGATVGTVTVEEGAQNADIVVETGAKVDNVAVDAAGSKVSVADGVTVADLKVTEKASGSTVSLASGAAVTTASISAPETKVDMAANSSVKNLVVSEQASGSSLKMAEGASVTAAKIDAPSSSVDMAAGSSVSTLTVTEKASGSNVAMANGATVTNAKVEAPNSTLNMAAGASVTTMVVTETAKGSTVATQEGAKIDTIVISAEGTKVTGDAEIKTANIKAPDVTMDKEPETVYVDEGIKTNIGNTEKEGTADTQNDDVPEIEDGLDIPVVTPPEEPEPEEPTQPPVVPSYPYNIAFEGNGSDGGTTMTNQAGTSSTSTVSLKANTFTKTNYTFMGWNTQANGSGTAYADGASVPTTVTKLYAQWLLTKTYNLKLDMETDHSSKTAMLTLVNNKLWTNQDGTGEKFAALSIENWEDGSATVYVDIFKGDVTNATVSNALITAMSLVANYSTNYASGNRHSIASFKVSNNNAGTGDRTSDLRISSGLDQLGYVQVALDVAYALGYSNSASETGQGLIANDLNHFLWTITNSGASATNTVYVVAYGEAGGADTEFVFEFQFRASGFTPTAPTP